MEERRKDKRYKAPFCVEYKTKGSSKEILGVIKDASTSGVRVIIDTPKEMAEDKGVSISILLPDGEVKISGKIVWIKSHEGRKEVGVCLSEIQATYKELFA